MREEKVPYLRPIKDADFAFGVWPWSKGPKFRLEYEDFHFYVPGIFTNGVFYQGGDFVIPKGYETNKASVPSIFWGFPFNYTPDGLCTVPSLKHDFLCDLLTGGSAWLRKKLIILPEPPPPAVVHEFFRLELHKEGVTNFKANSMGYAVKLFGPKGKLRFF